jgi:hypothetical protein
MVMAWQEWQQKAAKLNPNVSQQKLRQIYDRTVNTEKPLVAALPQKTIGSLTSEGLTLSGTGQNTAYDTTNPPAVAVDNMSKTGLLPAEVRKQNWMKRAKELNPTVSTDEISKIYDHTVVSKDNQQVSIRDKLLAEQKYLDSLPPEPGIEPTKTTKDVLPDFDNSDKVSMLGALLHSGEMGTLEGLAAIGQLALKLPEHYGMIEKGTVASLADKFERFKNQDQLYNDALLTHPATSSVGEFIGSILPSFAIPAEKFVGAGVKGMEWLSKGIPTAAKALKIPEEYIAKLGNASLM